MENDRPTLSKRFIEGVQRIETHAHLDAHRLSASILSVRFAHTWWDRQCFLTASQTEVVQTISSSESYFTQKDEIVSAAASRDYWAHYLAPLAAYGVKSRLWNMMLLLLHLDPGIKVQEIEKELSPDWRMSFWYSVGGNRLQDCLTGRTDTKEYTANILGLNSTERYVSHPSVRLSHLAVISQHEEQKMDEDEYKKSSLYQLAETYINPVIGDKILRICGATIPALCKKGIIPVQGIGVYRK